MQPDPEKTSPLDVLATSLSDGTPLDWAVASTLGEDEYLEAVALQDISRIAAFHRTLQRSPRGEGGAAGDASPMPDGAPRWGSLVLVEQLGAGASGEVWRAWDARLQREVALKFPLTRDEPLPVSGEANPLLAEARVLARLRHPAIVTVYGIAEHDGRVGMWMELLDGETLAAAIERGGPLAPAQVARIGRELALALDAVHEAGLVHRDVKPANVVLERGGRVVLTDFGLGRPQGGAGEPWRTAGTPLFMAPELFAGEPPSPRSDLYALGVTLRWALTGHPPFAARSLAELKTEALRGPLRALGDERPDVSTALAAAIEQATAPAPEARFARAADLAHALAGQLAAAVAVRHTLPAELDAFIGRAAELARLGERLAAARLVTLLGPGGIGKTRLAVHFGRQSQDAWPGGVWFCDLTEARDRNGIVAAVAGALAVPLDKGDPVTQLGHAIAGRGSALVILDNCEQVRGDTAAAVARWLDRAPEVRFLATSRERLEARGEEVLVVDPLGPEPGAELFLERARRHATAFAPAAPDEAAVREVVRMTEGLPLAIELAAARVRIMTVDELAARLHERFRVLGGTARGRHSSLEAVIDESWEMLAEWEQAAWAQCAVFEGGFTLAAAEGVLDLSAWSDAPWLVDVVQALADKSLLRISPPAAAGTGQSEMRFGMYVSLQEYARRKLGDERAVTRGGSGAAAERAAEERHGRWYARYGTKETLADFEREGGAERRRAERDLDNLLSACRRAVDRGDGDVAHATFRIAWALLELRGPMATALELGRALAEVPGLDPEARADVLVSLASAEWFVGRVDEARTHYGAALAIFRERGARDQEATVCNNLANYHRARGEIDTARMHYESALAICRDIGARRMEGVVLGNLGIVCREQGQLAEAQAHYEAALAIDREVGNRAAEGIVLSNLGNLSRAQGRLDEAQARHEAALVVHREVGSRRSEGHVLGSLGNVLADQGRHAEARQCFEAALAIHREFGDRRFEGVVHGYLGSVHAQEGQLDVAAMHYEAALEIAREVRSRRFECNVLGELGDLRRAQGRPAEARAHYESALAIAAEVGNRTAEGVVLGSLGGLLRMEGRHEEAREVLARSEAILRALDARLDLVKLLCARAELEQESGNTAAARCTLDEAEGLVARSGAGPGSELARLLAAVRQRLTAWL